MSGSLLLRAAGRADGSVCDLRIVSGRIVASDWQLMKQPGESVLDACGAAVIRGLHDHHVHLLASARALDSLVCGPPAVRDEDALARVLRNACPGADGWIRGTGFHDSVAPGVDRRWLDRLCPVHPLRIQHRSGMLWILNSAALAALGMERDAELPAGVERLADGTPSGRCFGVDAWLGERLGVQPPDLRALGGRLAGYGVTGVTDAGVRNGPAEWELLAAAQLRGELPQRVLLMGSEALDGMAVDGDHIARGPLKIYLREAEFEAFDVLVARVRAAHALGRDCAFHCVTRAELVVALAALEAAGVRAGDRIEHAAVCDDEALGWIVRLGLRVVGQPHFVAERGERYRVEVEPADRPWLWRAAAFLAAAVPFAAGTDAPYGSLDPWQAMRAAVSRCTADGECLGRDEVLAPQQAVQLFCGDPRLPGTGSPWPEVGDRADLCVLDLPWRELLDDLDSRHVRATLIDGVVVHQRAG
ncbi:MAG TPA: amidohydrolase family protein [Pseudomonadales bacterium]|nr:amidohydrolase family protein [Pseudomonadales bacterium]HNC68991.1 amidohydrolase family protein [Pseudomonadales bacterium]HND13536.1 amidohydrolase family protein [Pseudomonadales bacterium]